MFSDLCYPQGLRMVYFELRRLTCLRIIVLRKQVQQCPMDPKYIGLAALIRVPLQVY